MKRHLFNLIGIFIFVVIALGSGTSSQVINAQNNIAKQGTWLFIAKTTQRNFFYDPYTLNQSAPGVWNFMYVANSTSNASDISGPNPITIYCKTSQAEELLLQADGVSLQPGGIKQIPDKTALSTIKNDICGQPFPVDNNSVYYFAASKMEKDGKAFKYYIRENEVYVDMNSGNRVLKLAIFEPIGAKWLKFEFFADCSSKKTRFFDVINNRMFDWTETFSSAGDQSAVLWDRSCNDNRSYMKKVSSAAISNGASSSGGSLDTAKEKCLDLGIKAGTESFGKCVLQMSK